MNIKVLGFLLLIISGFSSFTYADADSKQEKIIERIIERIIEWPEVPLKAQQIITEHALGRKIFKVKQEKIILMTDTGEKNKTFLYLAGVQGLKGKKTWIIVDKDGELIDIEDEDTEIILEDEAENRKSKKDKRNN
ncbi:hypothetical protein [Nitrosomonas sp. Nm166]|uniref:hypothetical protein n=1 Tax=Nitrosomonas sp. Nm166 TaxID=1881054 RepID=UPI0008EDD4B3|nr:hypothetical protein [Nitrosomonas sp. Nm166]SFF11300.1 hypothetical protein SAMN05428977_10526 [Nitrosomonas sp. Nm166]